MNPVGKAIDRWLGRGDASITMPPMDGAFRPNDRLDAASTVFESAVPDSLALTSQGALVSSERSLFRVDKAGDRAVVSFDAVISALAGLPDGGVVAGLANGRLVFLGGAHDGKTIATRSEVKCITAIAPARDGTLLVANGSAKHGPEAWRRDLMEKNACGSVWRMEIAGGAPQQLAGNLAYPYGLIEDANSIVVAESWRSALTRISPGANGRAELTLGDLPAYPSRLSRGADDTIWLALFAPRSQLIEFVLSEDHYRRRMMNEIDVDYWVAPCLRSGLTPLEPTQQGGVKQLGVLKPWSPNRSYGLVAKLDSAFRPLASLHSRANGRRHGVTSCLELDGRLLFSAKGDGVVASYDLGGLTL